MELRAIQAVQLVESSATRKTASISEAWLDPELVAQTSDDSGTRHESDREEDEPFEDAEEFEVIAVSDLETDERPEAALKHVDVLA